ncbi:MAG TPA: lipocalin-like domain-containing protein [Longimicrobiales bacterium]|nr:lipocalin-like domain-containing protein [Longimicrobiales bacterium]
MRPALLPPVFVAASLAVAACGESPPLRATLSVAATLAAGDTAGFARAVEPRALTFPRDHGPHPEYRHEWWYFTGNLERPGGGAAYGFQLTFFRSALRPGPTTVASAWATSQAYMGHFALTDVDGGGFRAFERFERGALGLAGATGGSEEGVRIWVGDWEAALVAADGPGGADGPGSAWRVRAEEDGVAVDLWLTPAKPVVLQGDRGLSRKGPEPGNASYYYSLTRLRARGTVRGDGREVPVHGTAWLDREWGTSALGAGLAGWDWFSLQLDSGAEVMVYRLRREDGGTDRFSAGTYVEPGGGVIRLGADDFALEETGSWDGPAGVRYPSGWRVRIPGVGLDLRVDPRVRAQELDLAFRYWEGSVAVEGTGPGGPVRGLGYVELTGYGDPG